jgi:hypothetical protein
MGIAVQIQQWINSGHDYRQGVELYNQYGDNVVWKRVFAKAENSVNRKMLSEKLNELKQKAHNRPDFQNNPPKKSHSTPSADLNNSDNEWLPAFKEASRLHAELVHSRSPKKLAGIYKRLEHLFTQVIEPDWKRIDYEKEHGIPIPEPIDQRPVQSLPVAELYNITKNYPSRITKNKKRLAGKEEEKAELAREKIVGLETELAAAKSLLENAYDTFIQN